MNTLYQVNIADLGFSKTLSITSKRAGLTAESEKKVIPPVVEYDENGDITILEITEILADIKRHPYIASKTFPRERLADVEVTNILKHLEHFPTLPTDPENGKAHRIAEMFYGNIVFLRRTESFEKELFTLDYIQKMEKISAVLEVVGQNFFEKTGYKLDFFSVTKKEASNIAFLAGKSGIGGCLRKLSFGYHDLIPCDRIARELSSLKSAERFLHPNHAHFEIKEELQEYITVLKVGVIATKHSMLDSGDLMDSGKPKVACKLVRERQVTDWDKMDVEDRNLVPIPFKSGINLVHQMMVGIDEDAVDPSCIRLVSPGGIKIAAQYHKGQQAYDQKGNEIDLLIEFDTLAKKGALFLFGLNDPDFDPKGKTFEDLVEKFKQTPQEPIYLEDEAYTGYVLTIPFFRPGQRYTELCTTKDDISVDMISKSICSKTFHLPQSVAEEYKLLRDLFTGLGEMIAQETHEQHNEAKEHSEATN